jgi:GntR family transcriptional regulator/MocR family aminotransferase
MAADETSQPIELLLDVRRGSGETLGAQIEGGLREAIRSGALRPGARVPSTRDLARQLGVSRRTVVEAYSQLGVEGYLVMRQGARPHVSEAAGGGGDGGAAAPTAPPVPRYDFRPSVPDVSTFPRAAWLRAVREALGEMTDVELGYGDPRGADALRWALADYLGRVRGVVAPPARIVVTSGYTQALGLVCRALFERGVRRIAFEDPSHTEQRVVAARAGLEPVGVPVDDEGIVASLLPSCDAGAVVLTPAHQHPTGVVLSGERRAELLAWLRSAGAVAIEDDYDAEYRYDRAAVGALQGLDPERVVYIGSASKTLAPALRLGWMVVPPALLDALRLGKLLADQQTARIDQHAFALFLGRGELDRHLRRMRARYRDRRDALIAALGAELPDAGVGGVAAGLHATVLLRPDDDEDAIAEHARARRIALLTLGSQRFGAPISFGPTYPDIPLPATGPPTFSDASRSAPGGGAGAPAATHRPGLLLGYARLPEAAIRAGVRELAEAVREARSSRAGEGRE